MNLEFVFEPETATCIFVPLALDFGSLATSMAHHEIIHGSNSREYALFEA